MLDKTYVPKVYELLQLFQALLDNAKYRKPKRDYFNLFTKRYL